MKSDVSHWFLQGNLQFYCLLYRTFVKFNRYNIDVSMKWIATCGGKLKLPINSNQCYLFRICRYETKKQGMYFVQKIHKKKQYLNIDWNDWSMFIFFLKFETIYFMVRTTDSTCFLFFLKRPECIQISFFSM